MSASSVQAFRTFPTSKQFLPALRCLSRSSCKARSPNDRDGAASHTLPLESYSRRKFWTSCVQQFALDSKFSARNHSQKRPKYSYDPAVELDSVGVKDKIMSTTMNEAIIFEDFKQKGRRLPRVYVWGCSETGALGNAQLVHPSKPKPRGEYSQRYERAKKQKAPDPIPVVMDPYRCPQPDYFNLKVSHVAAGHGFSIWVNSNNRGKLPRVVGTGLNYESQLGGIRVTDKETGEERIIDVLMEPVDIDLPLTKKISRVTQVSCGRAHSVFLTDEGVFTMGSNAQGQCGRKIIENEIYRGNSVIHKVESIPDPVVQVVCGLDHTLFLTSTGSVYSCGWGADGQTGLDHYNKCDVPTLVRGDITGVKIRQISCKADCVLAVSEEGDLFGWGNSEYNQFSVVTPSTQVRLPRHLPFAVGPIKKASASASACAVLTESGAVGVWGYGILGLGPNVDTLSEPKFLPPGVFGITDLNSKLAVVDIQAGMSHFAAIVESPKRILDSRTKKEIPPFRELYTWGANRRGCLGLGRKDNQLYPYKVVLPASVNQVSCGTNHTIALCDPLLL